MIRAKRTILVALAALALSACEFEGTATGNPMLTSPAIGLPGSDPASKTTAIDVIAAQLCLTAVRCHSRWNATQCLTEIFPLTGFSQKLGVNIEPEPTLAGLRSLELQGKIKPDGPSLKNCLDDLLAFDCQFTREEDEFSDLATWLGPRCAGVEKVDASSAAIGD